MEASMAPENYQIDDSSFDLNTEFVIKLGLIQIIYGGTLCEYNAFTVTIDQHLWEGHPLKYINVGRRTFDKHLEEVCQKLK